MLDHALSILSSSPRNDLPSFHEPDPEVFESHTCIGDVHAHLRALAWVQCTRNRPRVPTPARWSSCRSRRKDCLRWFEPQSGLPHGCRVSCPVHGLIESTHPYSFFRLFIFIWWFDEDASVHCPKEERLLYVDERDFVWVFAPLLCSRTPNRQQETCGGNEWRCGCKSIISSAFCRKFLCNETTSYFWACRTAFIVIKQSNSHRELPRDSRFRKLPCLGNISFPRSALACLG